LSELIIRFLIGGLAVCVFSIISDLLKPKTFAGLFGAAPSVALASLALTAMKHGAATASTEARSMILGAVAFLIYASAVSYLVLRFRLSALRVSVPGLLLWLAAAMALWYAVLG
jgi:uncharacterized membrane protein (GlpM family)